MAHVISDECISCGACADTCPVNAIAPGDTKYVVDADACIDYAIAVGLEKGVPAVVTETPLDAEALQAQFAARGFKATAELQVMSGPAC